MDSEENKRLEDLAEDLVGAPSDEEDDDKELPEAPSSEAMEEAERLLQQASLAKIRGQGAVSERFLKQAAEVAEGSAAVQAALGDELWERKQYSKARNVYRMAHRLEPDNPAYETKWAESLVGSMGDPLSLQRGMEDSFASAKVATVLSMIFPGLGQFVKGDKRNGTVMMVLWIGGWAWAVLVPNGLSGIPAALGFGGTKVDDFNASVILPIAIVAFSWLWSVTSANARVKTQAPRTIDRPAPPGEGDFEL